MATAMQPPSSTFSGGRRHLDPERSRVEFRARSLYGLIPVKGRFTRFRGTLDLAADPAIELVVESASVDTGTARRDEHLRSPDFLDAAAHPELRFESREVKVDGEALRVRGALDGPGGQTSVEASVAVLSEDRSTGEARVEVEAAVDRRELGMTWSPLGMIGATVRITLSGLLVRD
jgi:polyisoprenoid-binding protein YceI